MNDPVRARILRDCLPILATYAWHNGVALSPTPVGGEGDLSISDFMREFRMRHALACVDRLVGPIEAVEAAPSSSSRLVRSQSRGEIRGRLDVQRYVQRRARRLSFPRRYPIVHSERTHRTPENELAWIALQESVAALRENPFPAGSSESLRTSQQLAWLYRRLYRRPWDDLSSDRGKHRLSREVQSRVRRRQTGNDTAYQAVVDWFDEWTLDLTRLGDGRVESLVSGLLSLPSGEAFWHRAFEIWCLELTVDVLDELGWRRLRGPVPLHQAASGDVYAYETPTGANVTVRFQRQSPLPPGRWLRRGAKPLGGIPDVSLSVAGHTPPLLIDAKFRFIAAGDRLTRSEEVYKMLGYAENFRVPGVPFRGVLIFPSAVSQHRVLDGPDGGRVDLVAVDPVGARVDALLGFQGAVAEWGVAM